MMYSGDTPFWLETLDVRLPQNSKCNYKDHKLIQTVDYVHGDHKRMQKAKCRCEDCVPKAECHYEHLFIKVKYDSSSSDKLI